MGSLCSRTQNWPGQDIFKTVLKFRVLATEASFLLSLLSQVSSLPPGLKTHPIYSCSLPLYTSKVFPTINNQACWILPGVCFLEESAHKKEGVQFFLQLLASEVLREIVWMSVDFSSICGESSSAGGPWALGISWENWFQASGLEAMEVIPKAPAVFQQPQQ